MRLRGLDTEILGLTADSREVRPGFLFAVVPGAREDGARYIRDAVRNGAAGLLVQADRAEEISPGFSGGVPVVVAEDVRKTLAEFADEFHGHPAKSLDLVGVTGTNGKTTTAYLLRHIFNSAGRKCGMTGTVEYDTGASVSPAPLTTPDAVRFTAALAAMRDSGCSVAVAEVSSHALLQRRVHPHRFAAAVFTNLTRDHLDYHGDMDAYFAAKRRLFLGLDSGASAIVNLRDPAGRRIAEGTAARVIGYALAPGDVTESSLRGQAFRARGGGVDREFRIPLVGEYNAENALGAILCARALGVDVDAIARALESFPGVPGRMERVDSAGGATGFVDYCHTDDALRSALATLRPLTPGRLIAVFGCGGDRDAGKRPLMARAAEEGADIVVLTSDNPRTEDPERILADIAAGFARPEKILREADRAAAVRLAASIARAGDAVLVAGKGHEKYQIIGTEKIRMDDRELLRDAFDGGREA